MLSCWSKEKFRPKLLGLDIFEEIFSSESTMFRHLILASFLSTCKVIPRANWERIETLYFFWLTRLINRLKMASQELENGSRIKYPNMVHSDEIVSLKMSNVSGFSRKLPFNFYEYFRFNVSFIQKVVMSLCGYVYPNTLYKVTIRYLFCLINFLVRHLNQELSRFLLYLLK